MTELDRIRDQFRRAFEGEAWHGPSVLSLLDGVTAQQAAAHPIPGAHHLGTDAAHPRGNAVPATSQRRSRTTNRCEIGTQYTRVLRGKLRSTVD